jgi:glutathione synthase/RimK-type ligase-like ATP-grasp enzyme
VILVITSSFDKTIDYMQEKHSFEGFFRLNLDQFSSYEVTFNQFGFIITDEKLETLKEKNCSSIYYRKPTPESIPESVIDPVYLPHIYREVFSFADGITESFNGRCLSRPSLMRKADNKLYQMKVANTIGFKTISSIITNKIESVKNNLNKPIVKPISSGLVETKTHKEFVQTNLVDFSLNTSTLKFSPSYFQNYQEKDFEVRLTVINGKFYPVKIVSKDKVDWRRHGNEIEYSLIHLPTDIEKKCIKFMQQMNLTFGCFDFIVKDNTWYFLEMNANGQWAWLDAKLNLGISDSLLEYLKNE